MPRWKKQKIAILAAARQPRYRHFVEKTGDRITDFPAEHGLETTFIAAEDGTRLRVLRGGNLAGPRLLCVHGFPQNAAAWRRMLPLVRDRFRVLLLDMRGFAGSDLARSDRYDLPTLTRDLETVLETTQGDGAPGPAFLCAHDWGACPAWELAATRPDLLRHYVCTNGPHLPAYHRALREEPSQRRGGWYTLVLQIPLVEHLLASGGAVRLVRALRGSSRRGTFLDEDIELYVGPFRDPARLRAGLEYYRQARRRLFEDRAEAMRGPRVTTPTTIVWGDDDPALPMGLLDIMVREFCPDARVVRLEGATHWVPDEEPRAVAEALVRAFAPSSSA
jgi:pimeloyl-ACP methyl ester carboxylesterase